MKHDVQTIVVRAAEPADLDAMIEITGREFRTASIDARIEDRVGGTPWLDIKRDAIQKECEQNRDGCFVALSEGQVVGYVTTTINHVASRGVIANLAVSSSCQGRGIGRLLLEHALAHFRKCGLQQAKIETLETNEVGRHLYPAVGFQEVTRQVHYVMALRPHSKGAGSHLNK